MPYGVPTEKQKPFPKKATAYVHSNKESMWELGEKLGLTGEELRYFSHALSEITVNILVNDDGSYEITGIEE